jgi:PqqD family protein of HPr-rel-A system
LIEGEASFRSVWVACDPEHLVWAAWPDAAAIYHRPSGKTHLLNPASVWLLQRLAEGPLAVGKVAGELAEHQGINPSPEYFEQVEKAIFRLGQWGLAHCVGR